MTEAVLEQLSLRRSPIKCDCNRFLFLKYSLVIVPNLFLFFSHVVFIGARTLSVAALLKINPFFSTFCRLGEVIHFVLFVKIFVTDAFFCFISFSIFSCRLFVSILTSFYVRLAASRKLHKLKSFLIIFSCHFELDSCYNILLHFLTVLFLR